MNTNYYVIAASTIDTVPAASSALTGTISSAGVQITGSGTAFLTELQVGDFIFEYTTNKEVRQIASISSDTELSLTSEFTSTVSNKAYKRTRGTVYNRIEFEVAGANATINNVAAATGQKGVFENSNRRLDPIVVENGLTTTVKITATA